MEKTLHLQAKFHIASWRRFLLMLLPWLANLLVTDHYTQPWNWIFMPVEKQFITNSTTVVEKVEPNAYYDHTSCNSM